MNSCTRDTHRPGKAKCAALAILLACAVLVGCADSQTGLTVRLSELQPLPTPPTSQIIPLRVSVAAVVSPRGTADSYQPLLDYLSGRLKRPVELVQRRTYTETNALVKNGDVDVAFICTSAYVTGHDEFGMQLLVVPLVKGATTYQSLLIVPAGSSARSIADLRGKVFAFTDPISTSGRIYPAHLVQQLGSTPAAFFGRTFFTYNHDNAIRAVATGLADGAGVDSLVYEYALEREPALAGQVRVIDRSPQFGIPPVVVGPKIQPQLQVTLREILLGMSSDPQGQVALRQLGIDAYVLSDDSAYDSVRVLVNQVGPVTP